jgi:hypothetical protein
VKKIGDALKNVVSVLGGKRWVLTGITGLFGLFLALLGIILGTEISWGFTGPGLILFFVAVIIASGPGK